MARANGDCDNCEICKEIVAHTETQADIIDCLACIDDGRVQRFQQRAQVRRDQVAIEAAKLAIFYDQATVAFKPPV